ncbi:MAG: hypothetical protein Q4A12_03420 [Eubacteriales bacterium]|nr:hypothetical protein [Eubacteriales bacterium]
MADSIFRKQSLDKVNSPEELDDYIKTSKPSVWLIIISVIVLLAGVFAWAFFGSLETHITIDGVAKDNTVICFTDDISNIKTNYAVIIGELSGTVSKVSEKPVSLKEATDIAQTDDYTLYCLELDEWNYIVEIKVDGTIEDGYVCTDIVAEKISPISFVLG